jgi:hypothetical protein
VGRVGPLGRLALVGRRLQPVAHVNALQDEDLVLELDLALGLGPETVAR